MWCLPIKPGQKAFGGKSSMIRRNWWITMTEKKILLEPMEKVRSNLTRKLLAGNKSIHMCTCMCVICIMHTFKLWPLHNGIRREDLPLVHEPPPGLHPLLQKVELPRMQEYEASVAGKTSTQFRKYENCQFE